MPKTRLVQKCYPCVRYGPSSAEDALPSTPRNGVSMLCQQAPLALTVTNRSMVNDFKAPSPDQEKRPSSST
jgi:hypothetical protein